MQDLLVFGQWEISSDENSSNSLGKTYRAPSIAIMAVPCLRNKPLNALSFGASDGAYHQGRGGEIRAMERLGRDSKRYGDNGYHRVGIAQPNCVLELPLLVVGRIHWLLDHNVGICCDS